MGYTVPTTEPASLRCGDTWQWRREDLSDYPAGTWTLNYYFRNATSHFDIAATADGSAYAVSVALATTAGYVPGWYDWTAFVTDGTERYQIAAGRTEVLPDLATAKPYDGRSFARRMLDYIEAALENRASGDQLDLIDAQLADRRMVRDRAGLIALRSQFELEVKRQDQVRTGTYKTRIVARFSA